MTLDIAAVEALEKLAEPYRNYKQFPLHFIDCPLANALCEAAPELLALAKEALAARVSPAEAQLARFREALAADSATPSAVCYACERMAPIEVTGNPDGSTNHKCQLCDETSWSPPDCATGEKENT